MTVRLRTAFAGLCAAAALVPAQAGAGGAHAPGELIVGFGGGFRSVDRPALHDEIGAQIVRRATNGGPTLVRFPAGTDLDERRAAYLARPEVAFAHRNYLGRIGFTPNDTEWATLWHHRNVGQSGGSAGADIESVPAWDQARGSSAVTVAIVDTGIDSDHPEFAGRIVPGFDYQNGDADPEDDNGHGTYVAGILAANANNSFGVAGVDHFCSVMPIKVVDASGVGSTFDLIAGIDHARVNGADVINLSLIDYPLTAGLDAALQAAEAAGLVVFACAGNAGIGDADVSAPGASAFTISVGATTGQDQRTAFSGTGQALEFVAPGKDVPTVIFDSGANGSFLFSGCSAATPAVAGIASILKALDPSLTAADVRALLRAGAEDQVGIPAEDTAGWDSFHGWGRVNFALTLQGLVGPVSAPDFSEAPQGVTLAAYPNPLRHSAEIRFELPRPGPARVTVHDVAGRLVRVLSEDRRDAGTHVVPWDASGRQGPAAPGVYFVRLQTPGASRIEKITLLR